ncbi:MAG TPA: L,D-transpeptidase/peptidoglycan binding protein [Baekduia sp.]|nr:L,D-transpeptidase/peptidoglycan binding protein [Baekduia sp.]
MRQRPLIALAVLLTALVALAAFALLYDGAHRDTIAKGVTVGGVDVGGLTRSEATARLQRRILEPLRQPIVVHHGKRDWKLTAREAHVAANIDATVDEALAHSREGSFITRTYRALTGGKVDAHLEPEVTYSDVAISRLMHQMAEALDREPVDATITFDAAGPQTTPSHAGREVLTTGLHRKIRKAIVSPTADRTMTASVRKVEPQVTRDDLATRYETALVVNRSAFKLELFKHLKLVKTYDIAVGAVGRETPAGLYHIQNKAIDPAWTKPYSDWVPEDQQGEVVPGGSPENPLKARWLGIYDGAGIHGIDPSEYGTIGHAASHGCVRMRIPDVEDLYPQVPVGTPIYIA